MFKRPTKKDIVRFEKADAIIKRRQAIEEKIEQWENRLSELQKSCPHYHSFYEDKGSSGHWDREDSYWRDYECMDCGKTWTTDQSYNQNKKYPHAVKGYKNNGEWHEGTKW